MFKLFRICKDRKRLEQVGSMMRVNSNVARLVVFLVAILMINHTMACLWIMAAKVAEGDNWLQAYEGDGPPIVSYVEQYFVSFYFVTTTVTTVGYGDICAKNMVELIFSIFMLIIGVMCFSFVSGSMSSIITGYDISQKGLKQKMATLDSIQQQYRMPTWLYQELKQSITFEHTKTVYGLGDFMNTLPLSLKCKLA